MRQVCIGVLAFVLPLWSSLSAGEAIENWRFIWTLFEAQGTAVMIDASEDGTVYRIKSGNGFSSLSFSADDADGVGIYLAEILAKPEEEIEAGKKVIGKRVVEIQRKDGALRVILREDRDLSLDMAIFNMREIKKVAAAFAHAKERIKLVNERMKSATAP